MKKVGFSALELIVALIIIVILLFLGGVHDIGFSEEYRIRSDTTRVYGVLTVNSGKIRSDCTSTFIIENLEKQDSVVYADTAAVALNATLPDTLNPDSLNVARLHAERSDHDTAVFKMAFKEMIHPDSALLSALRISQLIATSVANLPSFTQQGASIDSAIQAIDSTKITDGKLGIGDINGLASQLEGKLPINGTADSSKVSASADTANYADKSGVSDSSEVSSFADSAAVAALSDSSKRIPIATGSVRGSVIIGAGLSVTAGGIISVSGSGGSAYTDSVKKDGVLISGDSMATEEQVLQTVQKYLYVRPPWIADTSLTIGGNDSMDVYFDTENGESVIVVRAKTSAGGVQNLTFQATVENPQEFITLDSLSVTYKTTHAGADSQKLNIYVGMLNRFTGAIAITDSVTGLSGVTYATQRLYIGDSSIGKDDVVIVRFRTWSVNNTKAIRIKRTYLVYGA